MTIVSKAINEYLYNLEKVENPILREMEEYGKSRDFRFVGPVVGQLLMQLARIIKANRIHELGSGFGYSAAWFLLAMPPSEGEIICTDYSDENISRGSEYLERLGANGRINYVKGDALESLEKTGGLFDIIFNDLNKEDYPRAFEKSLPRLRSGGLFIADNVLWSGRVAESDPDEKTRAIMKFNELLFTTPGIISTIIPLRDGVSVSLKL